MRKDQKQKIALVALNNPSDGGAYVYEHNLITKLLDRNLSSFDYIICAPKEVASATRKRFPNSEVCSYRCGLLTMFFMSLRSSLSGYRILKAIGLRHGKFERMLIKKNVLLVYFLSPNPIALNLVDLPMINTVWDLGHRDIPEFVEITGNRHFEEREVYFQRVLPRSFRVVVDTKETLDKIRSIYGVFPSRIIVGGLFPDIRFPIQDSVAQHPPYLLYPAQFWPHKRHTLLLKAFKIVLAENPKVRLVLTGSNKGNLEHIIRIARKLGVSHAVDFKGFVDNFDLARLVAGATCMVFPSQLGPSNLPPLESAMIGTPCLISNVHNDSALSHPLITVVGKQSPEAWAVEINRILASPHTEFAPMTIPESNLVDFLEEAIKDFIQITDEWLSVNIL